MYEYKSSISMGHNQMISNDFVLSLLSPCFFLRVAAVFVGCTNTFVAANRLCLLFKITVQLSVGELRIPLDKIWGWLAGWLGGWLLGWLVAWVIGIYTCYIYNYIYI